VKRRSVTEELAEIRRALKASARREIAMAGEIERLQNAVTDLSSKVDQAIAAINAGKGLPAAVDVEAARVEAKTAELATALGV